MEKVRSADGTMIAYDRLGEGPPLVVVGGALCDRATTRPIAEALATRFTVFNPDRRGRGDSGNTAPYAVEREIEDLRALVGAAGGAAMVYGHSSGAGLAFRAAAAGVPFTRIVLHEPPFGGDSADDQRGAREFAAAVTAALAAGDPVGALRAFLGDTGMPADMVDGMCADPHVQAIAPTLRHDIAVMDDERGGTVPTELFGRVRVPTLLLTGGASPPFFTDTAVRMVAGLPDGTHRVLDGADHAVPPETLAPVLIDFLAAG